MPNSFTNLLPSLRGQANLTLQKVITYLLQEEKMLKTQASEPTTALFVPLNKGNHLPTNRGRHQIFPERKDGAVSRQRISNTEGASSSQSEAN